MFKTNINIDIFILISEHVLLFQNLYLTLINLGTYIYLSTFLQFWLGLFLWMSYCNVSFSWSMNNFLNMLPYNCTLWILVHHKYSGHGQFPSKRFQYFEGRGDLPNLYAKWFSYTNKRILIQNINIANSAGKL